ncbi:LemA family protein [Thiomicrorhabdus xiamenensis]|uniref:LemA family protein n=1 Tax=Thiomicrorhabdus xiamenensis TaxID=2739063 RepID=A0A7D4NKW4_9GAMM|nr:LemA family protein [Thiomicrorhabdus xiamenensis]QKI88674.1 LemA family protein [Thiomicrorhabdus xiamenensis]
MTTLLVILFIIIAIALYLIVIYNQLVKLKNRYQNAFAQIDVQMKRRYDLIPNLIEVAKQAMQHERQTLTEVIAARNLAHAALQQAANNPGDAKAMQNFQQAEAKLKNSLSGFNVLVEAYPDLKTNQTMMQLNEELSSTENRIAFARQAFNDAVMFYNAYRQSFPPILFAATFGHPLDAALLEFADKEQIQQAPKVQF